MTHQQLLPGESGIDRDHAVTPLEQISEGEIARPAGIRGNPDHRDRLHGVEDAADIAIVVVVVVHAGRLFALNIGSPRHARKSAVTPKREAHLHPRATPRETPRADAHSPPPAPRSDPAARLRPPRFRPR